MMKSLVKMMMEKVLVKKRMIKVIFFRAAQSCALNRLVKADSKVEHLKSINFAHKTMLI